MKNILLCLSIWFCSTAFGQDCPTEKGWISHGDNCYKFASDSQLSYEAAATQCQNDGAALVSVDNSTEHTFITNWLKQKDTKRNSWWTSGRTDGTGKLVWEGNGSEGPFTAGWLPSSSNPRVSENVIYRFQGTQFGWDVSDRWMASSYICEINRHEVYRISMKKRGFDYGTKVKSPSDAPRGPYFTKQPKTSILALNQGSTIDLKKLELECAAEGNPEVTYEWLKRNNSQMEHYRSQPQYIKGTEGYSTRGNLVITNPGTNDMGVYQCKASNDYGSILSVPVELKIEVVTIVISSDNNGFTAPENKGGVLESPEVTGHPGYTYHWYNEPFSSLMEPTAIGPQSHAFQSADGNYYFSSISSSDNGTYRNVIDFTAFRRDVRYINSSDFITTIKSQSYSKMTIKVTQKEQDSYDVTIPDEFIHVIPPTPMKGSLVTLECFAYGSLPLSYSWSRKNGPLPVGHQILDYGRVLKIQEAKFSDEDEYYCNVSSSKTNTKDWASVMLTLSAEPYFVSGLENQHMDNGSQLTWHCEAMGKPFPTYTWYKDGAVLTSNENVTVVDNTLTFQSLDLNSDSGMYQCGALNKFGNVFSTAQLRVIDPDSIGGAPTRQPSMLLTLVSILAACLWACHQ